MTTIHLSENAFVAEREEFLPVDTGSEKKLLQKQGKANGQVNSPDSQASQLDAVEQRIIQKVAQTAQQTRAGLSKHFDGFVERLLPIVRTWDSKALINTIQMIPMGAESSLKKMFSSFQTESALRGPAWQNAKEDYDKFRQHNNLSRPPDYLALKWIIGWFSILIVVEAGLNATLLWEVVPGGMLGAFGQMFLITLVNVLFGAALVGLCFRYKNEVSWKALWLPWICVPVVLVVLAFNFGVGHYRDALVEAKAQGNQLGISLNWDDANAESIDLDFTDYTKKAMESIIASPFGIESVLSVLFIIVGIGFFGFATHKWYSMFDPHPGYGKRDLVLNKTHRNYQDLVETTRKEMNQEIKDAGDRVSDERIKVATMRAQHEDLSSRAQTLQASYATWIVVLETTQNYLLAEYRDSNRKARSEPAPNHFDNAVPVLINDTLTELPACNLPNLQNVDEVIESVREAEHKIQEIADQIWQKFDPLANMQFNV